VGLHQPHSISGLAVFPGTKSRFGSVSRTPLWRHVEALYARLAPVAEVFHRYCYRDYQNH